MRATRDTLRLVVSDHVSSDEQPPADDARTRVLIADQDGLARRMMRDVLQSSEAVAAVEDARDGREALELARQCRPTVLLVDIALPPSGGVELVRDVMAMLPLARVVTVSAAAGQDQSVLAAFRAGAIGHIDKDIDPDQFVRLVTLAAAGETVVPRRLMTPLLERWRRETPAGGWRPMRSTLTTREWQIVDLLGNGASTEQIMERLVLSPSTVYSHIYRLLHKLGVHSRRDAVAAARRLRQAEASIRTPCGLPGEARRPILSA
ncbi:MAG TPA: response regulator transcription factor, partial [Solirubrobacteraceae bacterium]|nr:response regulator transcription factor [Solirubrobacteraceae bacterium]